MTDFSEVTHARGRLARQQRREAAAEREGMMAARPRAERHRGVHYIKFMEFVMNTLGTRTYFEIGTRKGVSLAGVKAKSVSVDPRFEISSNVIGEKAVSMFFQMTSDRFFEEYNLTHLLGGPVEVSFLDGFHVYEYLLRDFMNTEKHCKRNSLVFLHDCLPCGQSVERNAKNTARRDSEDGARRGWTGDVWKVVPILKKYRPNLRIYSLDCPPSGLVMITGLDPASRVLEDNYFTITDEFRESPDDEQKLAEFLGGNSMVATQEINNLSDLAKYTW